MREINTSERDRVKSFKELGRALGRPTPAPLPDTRTETRRKASKGPFVHNLSGAQGSGVGYSGPGRELPAGSVSAAHMSSSGSKRLKNISISAGLRLNASSRSHSVQSNIRPTRPSRISAERFPIP